MPTKKVLIPIHHWIDYNLYTKDALTPETQAQRIKIITDNLHDYLTPLISKGDQYSLVVNLYECADNPHLYHLTADVHIFPIEKLNTLIGLKGLSPERILASGGISTPGGFAAMSTQHNPPPGPPPPAPYGNANFFSYGEEFNLIQDKFTNSIGIGQASNLKTEAAEK
jgi:hypothetical protein